MRSSRLILSGSTQKRIQWRGNPGQFDPLPFHSHDNRVWLDLGSGCRDINWEVKENRWLGIISFTPAFYLRSSSRKQWLILVITSLPLPSLRVCCTVETLRTTFLRGCWGQSMHHSPGCFTTRMHVGKPFYCTCILGSTRWFGQCRMGWDGMGFGHHT